MQQQGNFSTIIVYPPQPYYNYWELFILTKKHFIQRMCCKNVAKFEWRILHQQKTACLRAFIAHKSPSRLFPLFFCLLIHPIIHWFSSKIKPFHTYILCVIVVIQFFVAKKVAISCFLK